MSGYDPYGRYPNRDGDETPGVYGYQDSQPGQGYEDQGYEDQGYEDPGYEEQGYEEEAAPYAPYEESAGHEQPYAPYEEPPPRRPVRKDVVLSTNATINLTCTLAACCGPFALFLCFAERNNRVIRRFAVQSAGLFFVMAFLSIALAVLGLILGLIPLVGVVFGMLMWAVWLALMAWDILQRVRLMLHAYRGLAYTVPLVGKHCRQFE